MKKLSAIVVLAVIILASGIGSAQAGPIDFVLQKLGVVRDDDLQEIRQNVSSVKKDVETLSSETTKRFSDLEKDSESRSWVYYAIIGPLWGLVLWSIGSRMWCRASLWWSCRPKKETKPSKQPPAEE